jgi:hypothetical protein
MAFRRASAILGVLALSAAAATPTFAQEQRKLSKDELAQYEAIHTVVDAVVAGKQPAPADVKVTFRNHFLKSGGDIYIPYSVELEPGKIASVPAVMYVRAVAKNPASSAAAAAPAGADSKKGAGRGMGRGNAPAGATSYAFEDVAFVTPGADNTIQRALELAPGDYQIYIALSEKPSKDKKGPAAKTVVYSQPLTVPDLLTSLTTSSIILAKNIEPSAAQLNGTQQLEQPYTVSGYKITPSSATSFPKTGELLWVFYIYNEAAAAGGKPDLNVDYNFFRAGEDKPFVNMPSSAYNATTLPPEFNIASGHMVFVAQGVPLTTFTPGEYKVQIKITDKTNSQSVTRDVSFSVTP